MPTNVPPEYYAIEKHLREATSVAERIMLTEKILAIIPHHKGTDKLIAMYRKKLSKYRGEAEKKAKKAKKHGITVDKSGDAQAVLLGASNAGKSSLFNALTSAQSQVAQYPYTTHLPIPGMMDFENVHIQLVDTPPLELKGVEAWLPSLARGADMVVLVVHLHDEARLQLDIMAEDLEKWHIRPAQMNEAGYYDAMGFAVKRILAVGTHADGPDSRRVLEDLAADPPLAVPVLGFYPDIPAERILGLKHALFNHLLLIRVYTRAKGKEPDFGNPVLLPRGATVLDFAQAIHKDFVTSLRYARVWGSAKFDGQRVERHHELADGDVIQLVI